MHNPSTHTSAIFSVAISLLLVTSMNSPAQPKPIGLFEDQTDLTKNGLAKGRI